MADVERFYRLYDATDGKPSQLQLQKQYIDPGTEGLKVLMAKRDLTAASLYLSLSQAPNLYNEAKQCVSVLPTVKHRLIEAMNKLIEIYPQAKTPAITIAISDGRSAAIGYPDSGVQVALELMCAIKFINPNIEDRFVNVIAHEFAHVQQNPNFINKTQQTVLDVSLEEGVAELMAELTSGQMAYQYFAPMVAGKEAQIEQRFWQQRHDTDLSQWVYNSTLEKPGDLGYWVGYRIAKHFYNKSNHKKRAIAELLAIEDAEEFLQKSGWQPGTIQRD